MRLLKPLAFSALFCAMVLLSHSTGSVEEVASCDVHSYEVMSLLIQEEFGIDFSLIVINSDTESWCLQVDLNSLAERWDDLNRETIDSLIVTNSGPTQQLAAEFNLPVEYELVSEKSYTKTLQASTADSEVKRYLESGNMVPTANSHIDSEDDQGSPNWEEFDKSYPDAQGYLTFSKVGYDSGCTQALLIYSNAYRCSGNRTSPKTRKIAYFRNINGSWELAGIQKAVSTIH